MRSLKNVTMCLHSLELTPMIYYLAKAWPVTGVDRQWWGEGWSGEAPS